MTEIRFVTREIGSLAKPGWHVKAIASRPSRDKTQVTTASNATSKCTITRSGTRRAAVRNSEANITAINRIGSLLLVDIEIESLSRKHPLKQRF